MGHTELGWALNLTTGAHMWRERFDDTEEIHEEKGRMMMEAEVGVVAVISNSKNC